MESHIDHAPYDLAFISTITFFFIYVCIYYVCIYYFVHTALQYSVYMVIPLIVYLLLFGLFLILVIINAAEM